MSHMIGPRVLYYTDDEGVEQPIEIFVELVGDRQQTGATEGDEEPDRGAYAYVRCALFEHRSPLLLAEDDLALVVRAMKLAETLLIVDAENHGIAPYVFEPGDLVASSQYFFGDYTGWIVRNETDARASRSSDET